MELKPRIETFSIKLVGIQGIIKTDHCTGPEVAKLWERVFRRVGEIKNRSDTGRRIGYWLFIDGINRVLFAGIEVNSFQGMREDLEDGFVFWDLGEVTWAIWEEKNGEEGTITQGGIGYSWLENSEYDFDRRFIGDFEVNNDRLNEKDYHEVWIPVVK